MGGNRRNWDASTVKAIFERDDFTCIYCGSPAGVIDHVIPVVKGGPTIKSNGVASCRKCNSKKAGKLEIDFITRGLFWLMQQGEDVSWVDDLS